MNLGRHRVVLGAALALVCAAPAARGGAADVERIVGTWRGTSKCVDLEAAPACRDEVVVYEVAAKPGATDKVVVKADKIVNGERQNMGDLEYTLGSDGTWTSDFESPRMRSHWTLTVEGRKMTGTGALMPSNTLTRRMDLEREK